MEIGKPLVLIIEDQRINREILRGILRQDYEVLEAENGQDALEVLQRRSGVAGILFDVVMPVMDGYTFLKELAKSPYSSIPTIAVTGEDEEGIDQKLFDLGAWDFVSKPYQPMTLLTRLKNVLIRSQHALLGETLLNSLGVATAVYQIEGETMKLLGTSKSFDAQLASFNFEINVKAGIADQPCLERNDALALAMAFHKASESHGESTCTFAIKSKEGRITQASLKVRYWGVYDRATIILAQFSILPR